MKLYHTDCLEKLQKMQSESVDSIVTDPPYGIGIFDNRWDKSLPSEEVWGECHRVLKPGGFILAFSSSRLYHRLAVAMEGAGFETQNMLAWLYGSSVPKGYSLALQFDRGDGVPVPDDAFRKYLRDAIEESPYKIKELEKLCGTGSMFSHYLGRSQPSYPTFEKWKILKRALKLDSTYDALFERMERLREEFRSKKEGRGGHFNGLARNFERYRPKSSLAKKWEGWRCGKASLRSCMEPVYMGQKKPLRPIRENVFHFGVGALNIDGCRVTGIDGKKRSPSSVMHDGSPVVCRVLGRGQNSLNHFYFVPKPSDGERKGNPHPTVKPVSLMRHLVRLVTPKGGVCLDPFMGSGTTGVAAKLEGANFVGMEKEGEFFEIARKRLEEPLFEEGAAA